MVQRGERLRQFGSQSRKRLGGAGGEEKRKRDAEKEKRTTRGGAKLRKWKVMQRKEGKDKNKRKFGVK